MTESLRRAIQRRHRSLAATVAVPGSKSLTNRALVCAALATGFSKVSNIAPGDDTMAMIAGLNAMGAHCIIRGDDVDIERSIDLTASNDVVVDANLAGTTARFLTAVGALRTGCTTVTGREALQRRPMSDLLESRSFVGAHLT
ncbi:MAG: 3-phosphoshikimate 1-carboxyvinyltransferase, partial [Ilumatobacteraceae bacterium]